MDLDLEESMFVFWL